MPTLEELLADVAEYIGEDKTKAKEFAAELNKNEKTKAAAQVLLNRGVGARTAAAAAQMTELEAEIARMKDELEETKKENVDLKSNEPNWQRRAEESDRKWMAKVEAAEVKADAERQARIADKVEIERQKFLTAVGLGREGGVEADWGRDVLPHRYADRFVPGEDGKVRVLEPGKTTSYDPEDGEPAEQLAKDVLALVPPKYRIMGAVEAGGGVKGAGGTAMDRSIAAVIDHKARTGMYQL